MTDPTLYQGLFYLSAGLGTFLILLLGLRVLAQEQERKSPAHGRKGEASSWTGRERLQIVEIGDESHDTKTLRFRREGGKTFPDFLPGQFLSFQIGEDEKSIRSYSISSSAVNHLTLQVSVKRIGGGLGSQWLQRRSVGEWVWAYSPAGHFTDAPLQQEQRVYVAGGIGITPILSMILTNIDSARDCDMILFYGMRSKADLVFHRLLVYLSERHSNFRYFPILSHDEWSGDQGFISLEYMRVKCDDLRDDAHYFVCGPALMNEALSLQLLSYGIDEARIHSEKFVSPTALDRDKIAARGCRVRFNGRDYSYDGRQSLLEFLESVEASPEIPYSCRAGVCGTCRCVVKGKVESLTDAGLTLREKQAGHILTCVSFPLGDIELTLADS